MLKLASVVHFLALGTSLSIAQRELCGRGSSVIPQNTRAISDSLGLCKAWRNAVPAIQKANELQFISIDSVLAWRHDVPVLEGGPPESYYQFWVFFRQPPKQVEAFVDRRTGKIRIAPPGG